jgi:hypothetical protein
MFGWRLAADFADLYRDYSGVRADGLKIADGVKRKIVGTAAYKPRRSTQYRLKSSR